MAGRQWGGQTPQEPTQQPYDQQGYQQQHQAPPQYQQPQYHQPQPQVVYMQAPPPKRNIFGRIVGFVVLAVFGLAIYGAYLQTEAEQGAAPSQPSVSQQADVGAEQPTQKAPAEPAKPKMTKSQEQATKKAKSYLSVTGFSRAGLIKQLEFEGFSTADATFGVDQQNADWNAQAAKKAKSYLDVTAFSRESLIKQLEFDGFTAEQAAHGATAVGL